MAIESYEFPCPACQAVFPLTTRQAGQEVECPHCSETVTAPRLGALKQLNPIETVKPSQPSAKANAGAGNLFFVFGLMALVIGGGCGFGLQKYAEKQLIVDYNVEGAMDRMDPYLDELSPFEVAVLFDRMDVDKGLGEWRELPHVGSTKQGNILLGIAYGLYGLAALGLLLMVIGLARR